MRLELFKFQKEVNNSNEEHVGVDVLRFLKQALHVLLLLHNCDPLQQRVPTLPTCYWFGINTIQA